MFTSNPFAGLSASVPPAVLQAYVVIMIVLVAAGTLFDIVHKGSAKYFFENWRKSRSKGSKQIGGGEWVSLAIQAGVVDVLASGEFCSARRRVAHLLTMYGFLIYFVTSAVMVFGYSTPATPTPGILPLLWWIGGLMICLGGYWFWFFIRVDVAAEGNFQVLVDLQENKQFIPNIIFNERTLFVGVGSVDAYVDFSTLSEGALVISPDGKSVEIKLPAPTLEKPSLDTERSYVFAQERGLVNRVGDLVGNDANKQQQLYQLAEAKIAEAAGQSTLRERAEKNTKAMLESLLHQLGYERVTVTFVQP